MKSNIGLSILTAVVFTLSAPLANADWVSEVSGSNPLNWWRFEETSGTNASDSGSGGNPGTLVNGASFGHAGLVGNAIHLDGTTVAQVTIGAANVPNDWTLETIFFQDATSQSTSAALLGPEVFVGGNASIKAEQFSSTGQLGYTALGVADVTFGAAGAATPSSFQHVVFVGTAAGVELFVDGVSVDSDTVTIDLNRGIIGLSGFTSGGTPIDPFGGFIDEMVVYDRALTPNEIASHAAATIVPEPATAWLLILAGVVACSFCRRKLR